MGKSRLLLLLKHRENKRLLVKLLTPRFELVLPSEEDPQLSALTADAFDLAIFDLVELGTWRAQLSRWRKDAEPLFLPMLALMPRGAVGALPLDVRYQIDELVTVPVDPAELDVRIAILLRARGLSQELALQNQRLEEMNKLKTRFVSVVSHEFRNPLSIISGMAQLLERQGPKMAAEKQQSMYRRIQSNVSKLTDLLEDLLILNRNASAQVKLEPAFIDLKAQCQKTLNDLNLSNRGSRQINFHAQGELSNVYVDAALIDTILNNLLSNALKYSPPDSVVHLSLQRRDDQIILEVKDRGRGIPYEDQPDLFEPFFRSQNVGSTPGTGLGLSIVKQCVDLHGGTIHVDSQVDRGTTFIVLLPSTAPLKS
ncbi:MAG: HAMP domain-containing sensor histidine kinase [Cyanobacteria bacterium P01_A01_bin.114]